MMKHTIVAILAALFLVSHAQALLAETISEHIHSACPVTRGDSHDPY